MNKTNIEYLDYTWNSIAMRCTPVSEGCEHCWHLKRANMLMNNPNIDEDEQQAYAGGYHQALLREDEIDAPERKRGNLRIGVQFMGDLFHPSIPFCLIHRIFDKIWQCPQHTFVILTKRPERAFEFMTQKGIKGMYGYEWPLKNVIGMVTAENQHWADIRISWLLRTPFAYRGVSVEPMLGAVDLATYLEDPHYCCWNCGFRPCDGDNVHDHILDECPICGSSWDGKRKLSWVICGGETGPGARPMHPEWVRSLRDQCRSAGVPFFFKQWGYYIPPGCAVTKGHPWVEAGYTWKEKNGGRLLDGREWLEYPKEA